MKIIDVLNLMAQVKIKQGTKLEIGNKIYTYTEEIARRECYFIDIEDDKIELLEDAEIITEKFLNFDVKLIEPKKFLVKFNMRGLQERFTYLNYGKNSRYVHLHDKYGASSVQTEFTEDELQSIQPVKEFLEDMQGKFELIEVEECD